MSLGIPLHMPRTADGAPDWIAQRALGGLEAQRANHWIQIYQDNPVQYPEDKLVQLTLWLEDHYEVPLFCTLAYVIAVFGIQAYMKDKKPFDLRWPLAAWNWALSIFSMLGTFYLGQVTINEWVNGNGFVWEMCSPHAEHATPWVGLFILSKIPELLDTIFIVLRKKPLIFLHWYHHIVTMWFCWFAWARRMECGGGFALMNLFVHSIMYGYYACSAMGIYWPAWARQSITTLQLSQMVGGLIILGTMYIHCPYDLPLLYGGFTMYFSYFVLFAILFYDLYFSGKKQKAE